MLPSVVAKEVQHSVSEFLREAFRTTTAGFVDERGSVMERFLSEPDAVFKGPWLDIKLPFKSALSEERPEFRHFDMSYTPYAHQLEAFRRLRTDADEKPKSTIIATGTGSGKTECFWFPLLDHCLAHPEPGVKAIIVYPMNALATDQARRFARFIAELNANVRVGMYTGDTSQTKQETAASAQSAPSGQQRAMSEQSVITCREELRGNPPDILLTNYKMLDYLLMRPQDQPLWKHNLPGTLRYLVVDELHTFDGAQGTDLACLIRRLRARLQCGDELLCVGTSATIGSGASSVEKLRAYATEVFRTPFDEDAIIGETRLTIETYLAEYLDHDGSSSHPDIGASVFSHVPLYPEEPLEPAGLRYEAYLERAARAWFPDTPDAGRPAPRFQFDGVDDDTRNASRVRLAYALRAHTRFRQLLEDCRRITNIEELADRWAHSLIDVEEASDDDRRRVRLAIDSLVSLIAYARDWRNFPGGAVVPMLHVRGQLWMRELRRMVASISASPTLTYYDDVPAGSAPHLPLVHCRECLALGWGTRMPHYAGKLSSDVNAFYRGWFEHNSDIKVIYPLQPHESVPLVKGGVERFVCCDCGEICITDTPHCPSDESLGMLRVWIPEMAAITKNDRTIVEPNCAHCGTKNSLMIVGSRAASIASVAISQLFGSNYAEDRKLITFSDSVQDAAHRAGFFGARTFNHVSRLAMEHVIAHHAHVDTLEDFGRQIGPYWREKLRDEDFVATFIAPNMEWFGDFENLKDTGVLPAGSKLADHVERRMQWDALMEFGLRARHGRSLERRGVATVAVDEAALHAVATAALQRLREQVEAMRDVSVQELVDFLRGALTRWRYVGAWLTDEMVSFVELDGNTYPWTQKKYRYLPNYGSHVRPPAPLVMGESNQRVLRTMERISSNVDRSSIWMADWFRRTIGRQRALIDPYFVDIMVALTKQLQTEGLLVAADKQFLHAQVFLLDPSRWHLSRDVVDYQCTRCHRIQAASGTVPEMGEDDTPGVDPSLVWEGTPCLRYGCTGIHQRSRTRTLDADRAVPVPTRLVPSEHTGLLDGEKRKAIEESFISGTKAWDINLLSSTPTLEMGIDIGDLSSVLLCSVPPTQANYLQRIGRAGRKDGNALALVIANGVDHDNYFYADPREMMAGDIATPGVFLGAMAVLERQLIAYCFDRWAMTGLSEYAIPKQLSVVFSGMKKSDRTAFPHPLLAFIEANDEILLRGFLQMFDGLVEEGETHLRTFLCGGVTEGSLAWRILDRLQRVLDTRENFARRIASAKADLRELKKLPQDEATDHQIEWIQNEISGLTELRTSIDRRHTLNFFTDEGLLPNYAFPEEGVTLDSVILKEAGARGAVDAEGRQKKYNFVSMKFQRSAASALSELAPESRFYAAAHQLKIEQVDLDLSRPELWRLCDRCHYSEHLEESGDRSSVCPRCGSEVWADVGQKRTLVRLRQVYSFSTSRRDRIDDSQESRTQDPHQRQLLVDIPAGAAKETWRIANDEMPFGFEYLSGVGFREINFGSAGTGGETFSVAGESQSRRGFQICKHCGMVRRPAYDKNPRPQHARDCEILQKKREETEEDWLNSLYLYRELHSETIRILLPIADIVSSKVAKQSFIAAIQLGLRQHFEGNVHHLDITEVSAYDAEVGTKAYLLIYDRVPGGTGYLKDLMRSPSEFFSVIEKALRVLVECDCEERQGTDGCYRCILAYRQARHRRDISRRSAIQLFEALLANKDNVQRTTSLESINMSSLLESAFEKRLVEEIGKVYTVKSQVIRGKAGYYIFAGENTWELAPQEEFLDPQSGAVVTRSDMLLRLTDAPGVEDLERFDTYIFTDGYKFHASKVRGDIEKRNRILSTGKKAWVFSWRDLPTDESPGDSDLSMLLEDGHLPKGEMNTWAGYSEWLRRQDAPETFVRKGSFGWLLELLRAPVDAEQMLRAVASIQVLSRVHVRKAYDAEVVQTAFAATASEATRAWLAEEPVFCGGTLSDADVARVEATRRSARMQVAVRRSLVKPNGGWIPGCAALLWADDIEMARDEASKPAWEALWPAFNLMQFTAQFAVASASALAQGAADDPWPLWPDTQRVFGAAGAGRLEEPAVWADVFDPVAGAALDHGDLRRLLDAGVDEPEVGADITDGKRTVATGELVWSHQRVAVSVDATAPRVEGWTFVSSHAADWVDTVLSSLLQEPKA